MKLVNSRRSFQGLLSSIRTLKLSDSIKSAASSDSDEPCRMVADPEVQLDIGEHDRTDKLGEHGKATISRVTVNEQIDDAIKGYQSGVSVIEEAT